jgi:hypothetical protein
METNMSESKQVRQYREQLERERAMLAKRDARFICGLVSEVIAVHEVAGFHYPISPLIMPSLPPIRVSPVVKFGLPPGLSPNSIEGMYVKVAYHPETSAIYFNVDALYETPRNVEDLRERMEEHPELKRKLGWVGKQLAGHCPGSESTTRSELGALVSRELGKYLIQVYLEKFPDSWLHVADDSATPDFAAQLIKNGIFKFFERMYSPQALTISDSVWKRDCGDPQLARRGGSLRRWYVEECGVDIVASALLLRGDKAFEHIATHKLDIGPDYQLERIPQYGEDLLSAMLRAV